MDKSCDTAKPGVKHAAITNAGALAIAASALVLSLTGRTSHAMTLLPDAAFLQTAVSAGHPDTVSADLGLQWHWTRRWRWSQNIRLSGYVEFALGRWAARTDGRATDLAWITQLSVVPVLQWSGPGDTGWYVELGIGPAWMNPIYRSENTSFSSNFQFRDHLGIGRRWGHRGRHSVGLRFVHFSNASFETPNPGVNFFALRYSLRFR